MPSRPDGFIRAFGMSGIQISNGLKNIERKTGLILEPRNQETRRKTSDYRQFAEKRRIEAQKMSEFYEIFYCLENSIRDLVSDIMLENAGTNWWRDKKTSENNAETHYVDQDRIQKEVEKRRNKEKDSGVTLRSDKEIDYTTFGELSQIITDNWEFFDSIFQSKRAVSNITNQLNLLRGPIAHCNPTDDLEKDRLDLAVKTWFQIMS